MTYTLTLPDQSEQEVKGLQEGLFAAVDILLREHKNRSVTICVHS